MVEMVEMVDISEGDEAALYMDDGLDGTMRDWCTKVLLRHQLKKVWDPGVPCAWLHR
jgi:hypothetical protein